MTITLFAVAVSACLAAFVLALVRTVRRADAAIQPSMAHSAIEHMDTTLQAWNETLRSTLVELRSLESRAAASLAPARGVSSPLAPRPVSRPVVRLVGGRVSQLFAMENISMAVTAAGRSFALGMATAGDRLGFNAQRPLSLFVPTLGRPRASVSSATAAVAAEDMFAAEAVVQAVLAQWPDAMVETHLINPGDPWTERRGNVGTLCRGQRNPVTEIVLADPAIQRRFKLGFQELPVESGRASEWGIVFGDQPPRRSPSYEKLRNLEAAVAQGEDQLEVDLEDYALLARFPNPWDPEAKVLVVAGVRAMGTWGAASYLTSNWHEIAAEVEGLDFACLLSVHAKFSGFVVQGAPDSSLVDLVRLTPPEDPLAPEVEFVATGPATVRILEVKKLAA